ncbi:hypothetical protein FB45DRAFT_917009 [Roridomyces roridus]|uniref:Uncharacterized protein n=1 Tax=Roridomyces roridus TaxID=1738132 RepID=A0AAD7BUM7_9AGAR|nr:hypothetical protein FB45DRAFT_917009 [Roridomyces roridus]
MKLVINPRLLCFTAFSSPFCLHSLMAMPVSASRLSLPPPSRSIPLDRRYSATLTPRPLRSSPLAGPVLSRDGIVYPKSAPTSRTSSLVSLDESLRVSLSAAGHLGRPPTAPAEFGGKPRYPDRRRSASAYSLASRRLEDRPDIPPIPPLPSTSQRRVSQISLREATPDNIPNTASTRRASQISLRDGSAGGDHWLTAAPYDTIPRFSRLSIAAPGVVMPVRKGTIKKAPSSVDSRSVRSVGSVPSLSSSVSSPSMSRPSTPRLVFTPPPVDVVVPGDGATEMRDKLEKKREGKIKRLWRRLTVRRRQKS